MSNKCEQFLKFFDYLVANCNEPIPEEVQEFYDILKDSQETYTEKPEFTETGLEILRYMQECNIKSLKAKDVAEGILSSSRKVSGAMRKLCTDGYVEKYGKSPVIYTLSNKGKELNIKEIENSNET